MFRYLLKRLFHSLFVIWGVATAVFLLIRLIPGDPVLIMLGDEYSPEAAAALTRQLGLDQPAHVQYALWFRNLAALDLGRSVYDGQPVVQAIAEGFPRTLSLTLVAFVIGIGVAIPAGIVAAVRRYRPEDQIVSMVSFLGISMPSFWFGIILILVFAVNLRMFPSFGYAPLEDGLDQWLRHLILPGVALGLGYAAIVMRITRGSMIEVLGQMYVRTARAKGVHETLVLLKHALPNALIPVVTVAGIQIALLLSGSVIIETVFGIRGAGRLFVSAVTNRDYPLLQGIILLISLLFVAANLVVDLLYAAIDPRIRYQRGD